MLLIIGIVGLILAIAFLSLALFEKLPATIVMNNELNTFILCAIMVVYGISAFLMTKWSATIPSLLMIIGIVIFILTKVALAINVKSSLRNVEPELNNTVKQIVKNMK